MLSFFFNQAQKIKKALSASNYAVAVESSVVGLETNTNRRQSDIRELHRKDVVVAVVVVVVVVVVVKVDGDVAAVIVMVVIVVKVVGAAVVVFIVVVVVKVVAQKFKKSSQCIK